MAESDTVLEVTDLETHFFTREGVLKAVNGVSFSVSKGETLGVVGESGCGKSMTALSIMQLVPEPPGRVVGGRVVLEGINLLELSRRELEDVRGNSLAMIFQEPLTAMNPLFSIGNQLGEVVERHTNLSSKESQSAVASILQRVGLPDSGLLKAFPHQLSGGMRQRAMIAMALIAGPRLLIADEPTTALDVTIQAQILELMRDIRDEEQTATIMITHDLGVIADVADTVLVMYAGRIVESAPVRTLFDRPAHPYTVGLHSSIPKMFGERRKLSPIPGQVPTLPQLSTMPGCKFASRCTFATDRCVEEEPPLEVIAPDHSVRCWHYDRVLEAAAAD